MNTLLRRTRRLLPAAMMMAAAVLAACDDGGRRRMEAVLERAHRQNQAYDSITHVDSIEMAVRHFDSHGTANERMRAHYLLASAYRDMGDAPRALSAFHDAASQADTTAADCDFALLSRVHGQIALMLSDMQLAYDGFEEWKKAERIAYMAGDTAMAIGCYAKRKHYYYFVGDLDSCIAIAKKAFADYMAIGDTVYATYTVKSLVNDYMEKDELDSALYYAGIFEKVYDYEQPPSVLQYALSNWGYVKGMLYLKLGQADSAKACVMREDNDDFVESRLCLYKGLTTYYAKTGDFEEALKYSTLFEAYDDSLYRSQRVQDFQRMQSLFNYEHSSRMAAVRERQLADMRLWAGIVAAGLASAFILLWMAFAAWRRRRLVQMRHLEEQYGEVLRRYEQARSELESATLEKEKDRAKLRRKRLEVEQLKQKLAGFSARLGALTDDPDDGTSGAMRGSELLQRIHFKTSRMRRVTESDIAEVREQAGKMLPGFIASVRELYPSISMENLDFCIFTKLHFASYELQAVFGMSPQSVTNHRRYLCRKMFGEGGGARDFNEKIRLTGESV